MTEAEQGELAQLRKLVHDLRTSFSMKHLRCLQSRLWYIEGQLERGNEKGIVMTYALQEASATRHAIAFMKAVAALTSAPKADPAARRQLADPGGAGDGPDHQADSGGDQNA